MGVCVPWCWAHVKDGHRNRELWQDHIAYLVALREVLASFPPLPTVVVGDFNQRVPHKGTPKAVHEAFVETFGSRFKVATAGTIAPTNEQTIDHVLHTRDLRAAEVRGLSNTSPAVKRLSDHFGVMVTLEKKLEES